MYDEYKDGADRCLVIGIIAGTPPLSEFDPTATPPLADINPTTTCPTQNKIISVVS